MKELPAESFASWTQGFWFVHKDESVILKVWLSSMNGKEKVYLNDKLVSEARNISKLITLHEFTHNGRHYNIEIFARNLGTASFECNIFRNGKLLESYVNKLNADGMFRIEKEPEKQGILERNLNRFRQKAVKMLKEFDLDDAYAELKKVLNIAPEDAESFYHLAGIYSLREDKEKALEYLEKAVTLGLKGKDRILSEDNLAFIRIQPEFATFKEKYLE